MRTFIDQHGRVHRAETIKELYGKVGGARPSKMYRDGPGNTAIHIGYVIGGSWLTEYAPVEKGVEEWSAQTKVR